jgi:monoamine oxidase
VVEHLDRVFPGVRGFVENGVTKCWDQDPWSRGAYGSFGPGQMLRMVPYLTSIEGRVHFAGDHTSPWVGWMQGALHSGNRVAREIDQASAV